MCSALGPTGENLLPEGTITQSDVSVKEAITSDIPNIIESIQAELKKTIQRPVEEAVQSMMIHLETGFQITLANVEDWCVPKKQSEAEIYNRR